MIVRCPSGKFQSGAAGDVGYRQIAASREAAVEDPGFAAF